MSSSSSPSIMEGVRRPAPLSTSVDPASLFNSVAADKGNHDPSFVDPSLSAVTALLLANRCTALSGNVSLPSLYRCRSPMDHAQSTSSLAPPHRVIDALDVAVGIVVLLRALWLSLWWYPWLLWTLSSPPLLPKFPPLPLPPLSSSSSSATAIIIVVIVLVFVAAAIAAKF